MKNSYLLIPILIVGIAIYFVFKSEITIAAIFFALGAATLGIERGEQISLGFIIQILLLSLGLILAGYVIYTDYI